MRRGGAVAQTGPCGKARIGGQSLAHPLALRPHTQLKASRSFGLAGAWQEVALTPTADASVTKVGSVPRLHMETVGDASVAFLRFNVTQAAPSLQRMCVACPSASTLRTSPSLCGYVSPSACAARSASRHDGQVGARPVATGCGSVCR